MISPQSSHPNPLPEGTPHPNPLPEGEGANEESNVRFRGAARGLILTVALMLTACASGMPPTTAQPRLCAAALTATCPAPPPARSGRLQDLLDNHIEAMELYSQCRDQMDKLRECLNPPP